jgi:hypothetical protein
VGYWEMSGLLSIELIKKRVYEIHLADNNIGDALVELSIDGF